VGPTRRTARVGEFRSNIHRGGHGRIIALDDEFQRVAVKACEVMGLHVAGVDLLESKEGPKIIEINSSPGFEGLEAATGRDIAGEIIEYAVSYAAERTRARRRVKP
jgi:ribosomal protein S6--L-glutamate ligase